jgi:hypothetical protein
MRLVHYADGPVSEVRSVEQSRELMMKPSGLWVSDDDCEDNWRAWCEDEGFRPDRLTHVHDVTLVPNANVLILRSAGDIDAFSREAWPQFEVQSLPDALFRPWVRPWDRIAQKYGGLIITPYIWERRLSYYLSIRTDWYYGWDCASGCIWDPTVIASISLRSG